METLETFKDVPDEIASVSVSKSYCDFIDITWAAPDGNNSKITSYNVYLSDKEIYDIGTVDLRIEWKSNNHCYSKQDSVDSNKGESTCKYRLQNLRPNTAYFVVITACNQHGEGYKPDIPSMVRTQPLSISNTSSLYIWGSNTNSQLGLTEKMLTQHRSNYFKNDSKSYLSTAVKHEGFQSLVHQVASGNINTTVLCFEPSQQ